jgi:hypothetical protein
MWGGPMSFETWLAMIGIVVGVLGLVVAYIFYRKTIRTKVLALAYTDPIPLVMTLGDITVEYMGTNISALSRVYVLLWNRGTSPIEAQDFITPIEYKLTDQILKLEIYDKDMATSANLDPKTGVLTIDLLRPGEALVVIAEVASETYRPDLQIAMKSSEMSTVIRGYRAAYPGAIAVMTILLLVIVIIGMIVSSFTMVDPIKTDVNPGPSLIGLGLFFSSTILFPFAVGGIIYWLARKIISRATTPVAWRFSERKIMALNIRQQFAAFKKFMSIVNKQS